MNHDQRRALLAEASAIVISAAASADLLCAASLCNASDETSVARSPTLFQEWKNDANVVEVRKPPAEVISHFNDLYRLEEVPRALAQVAILPGASAFRL